MPKDYSLLWNTWAFGCDLIEFPCVIHVNHFDSSPDSGPSQRAQRLSLHDFDFQSMKIAKISALFLSHETLAHSQVRARDADMREKICNFTFSFPGTFPFNQSIFPLAFAGFPAQLEYWKFLIFRANVFVALCSFRESSSLLLLTAGFVGGGKVLNFFSGRATKLSFSQSTNEMAAA